MALVKRKVAITLKPSLVISKTNDDLWSIAIDMRTKGTETLFREGNEVDSCKFLYGSFC